MVDLIVVGAGLGGLTAAALAAAEGLEVLVLEAHTRPGGCAGDYWRKGLRFPSGATLLSGFEPGGLHRQVYRRLGLVVRARPLDQVMEVLLPDETVRIPTERAAWDLEWRRAFPGQERAKAHFWRHAQYLADQAYWLAQRRPTLPPRRLSDLGRLALLARPALLGALPALWRTVGDQLRASGADRDARHRRFLDAQLLISMQCESDQAVALNGAPALELYRYGCFHVPGGAAGIAADLEASLRASGGRIDYRRAVRVVSPDPAGWRVRTAEGGDERAAQVILNPPIWNLPALLGEHCPAWIRRRAAHTPRGWGALLLNLVVDRDGLGDLPRFAQTIESYDGELGEGRSAFVSLLPADNARRANLAMLSVSTHSRAEAWFGLSREGYQERQQITLERLRGAARRVVPDLDRRLRHLELATPVTFQRFTGRAQGMVGGIPQTPGQANFGAISHRAGPPGLWLCGDTIFPGPGTVGVTLSGIQAAHSAVRAWRPAACGTRSARPGEVWMS